MAALAAPPLALTLLEFVQVSPLVKDFLIDFYAEVHKNAKLPDEEKMLADARWLYDKVEWAQNLQDGKQITFKDYKNDIPKGKDAKPLLVLGLPFEQGLLKAAPGLAWTRGSRGGKGWTFEMQGAQAVRAGNHWAIYADHKWDELCGHELTQMFRKKFEACEPGIHEQEVRPRASGSAGTNTRSCARSSRSTTSWPTSSASSSSP